MTILLNDNNSMINHVMDIYKMLFGEEERRNISLEEDSWEVDERVTTEENEASEADFSKEETRKANF
jgi:hypothetical protein